MAAFTDEMIRAAVRDGRYSDPRAEALLGDVLIKRRQKIAAAYLPAMNPLVDFSLTADGELRFRNAAVDAGVAAAPAGGYQASWSHSTTRPARRPTLGPASTSRETRFAAPSLPSAAGTLPAGRCFGDGSGAAGMAPAGGCLLQADAERMAARRARPRRAAAGA